jgi:hypothetical protein
MCNGKFGEDGCGMACCYHSTHSNGVGFSIGQDSHNTMAPGAFMLIIMLCCGGFCCCAAAGLVLKDDSSGASSQLRLIAAQGAPRPLMLDEAHSDDDSDFDEKDDIEIPLDAYIPPHWVNRDMHVDFDERYDAPTSVIKICQRMLNKTWKDVVTRDRKGKVPSSLQVMSVQRVEDRKMWAAYQQAKKEIRKKRGGDCMSIESLDGDLETGHVSTDLFMADLAGGPGHMEGDLNEHYFFHGTSPEGAHGISESGFMINLAGTNAGTMFGKGAYFAEKSSKADEYASTNPGIYQGIYSMLVCRVVCGDMYRVTRSDIPAIEKAMKSGAYDSVLGDREASVGTYREFVVFRERQIYPEYVVLYRRVTDDESDDGGTTS